MMARDVRRSIGLFIASFLLVGCLPGGFDWMLEVVNATDEAWYIRVQLSDRPDETLLRVALVPAHAQGPSVAWFGAADASIELLDENCRLIGTFGRIDDGLSVAVPDVPGVTGQVVPHRVTSADAMGGIELTDDCGGFLYV